ncbi:MAG: hypothetical protein N2712_08005, partial [Brevinematales bacterium]|nr:hypothetical protein [Brevinematales bacterium]
AWRFETENLQCEQLKELPFPVVSGNTSKYIVQINKSKNDLIKEIKQLVKDSDKLLKDENKSLPRIYFDRSLYLPLLIQSNKIDKISPAGLVESEEKFLKGLKEYLEAHKDKFDNFEIYLLRNYPFSVIGFQL